MNVLVRDLPVATSGVAAWEHGRLRDKVILVTGAAGNLGSVIVRRLLVEGAAVIFTGRDRARTEAARAAAIQETGVPEAHASCVVMDAGKPDQVRDAIAQVLAQYGRIDVVLNNAGSAGPRQTVQNLPLSAAELKALQDAGAPDSETVSDAVHNILGVAWNLIRVTAPNLAPGASVINVSSIFSRTEYFGRAAYTVPKAAMNALTREVASELGARGIRVNNLIPGPIASDRIRSVFSTMDMLRGDAPGTMAQRAFGRMSLARAGADGLLEKTFPIPEDVASACVFLASDESCAMNGADFEMTHGMRVSPESRSTFMARPNLRSVDANGARVLIAAGEQVEEALAIARALRDCGAQIVLGFATETDALRAQADPPETRISFIHLDRDNVEEMDELMRNGPDFTGAIVMPTYGPGHFRGELSATSDAELEGFVNGELCGILAITRMLARGWKSTPLGRRERRVVFLTNGCDATGNVYANLLRAATEQLIRVWRDETIVEKQLGRRTEAIWANQIVRYQNSEAENIPFAAGHAARLLFKEQKVTEINLYIPENISAASGARRALLGYTDNLTGLHLGKVALITGSSAGIGGQVARLLAIAGAKVMLAARRGQELEKMRARIEDELRDAGYPEAGRRVRMLAGIDVGDPSTLHRAVAATIEAFGRIDYLINNAGVSGAEEMVVDMKPADWRYTLEANLISNYALIHEVAPLMKAQGSGYVLNVSSYFGGEKCLAVAYPNRADYAVSKAGQRAMVETMAGLLGPEIQINAIAPGPVDGERLAGTGGKPGLYERRGRLILEKKRLNAVHAAIVRTLRQGTDITAVLGFLASNDVTGLAADETAPAMLRDLARHCAREGDCDAGRYILTVGIAQRLLDRLHHGGSLRHALNASSWLKRVPGEHFFPAANISKEAERVRTSVLGLLNLKKMPTETEVALATVFFLADRAVTGETFLPSGGLSLERPITELELFGGASADRLAKMAGRTVWLIGEHLTAHLAEAARGFVIQAQAGAVVALMRTQEGADALKAALAGLPEDRLHIQVCGDEIENGMERALGIAGRPAAVISTPYAPLPDTLFTMPDGAALDGAAFRAIVDTNLTHHFRVGRIASLFDTCQIVLVSPDLEQGQNGAAFALANFIKTTLHALTLTLAVENERMVHDAGVSQINLTRRARSEEPRNAEEQQGEIHRFGRAVLLAGAPPSDGEEARARARINRGMAVTV